MGKRVGCLSVSLVGLHAAVDANRSIARASQYSSYEPQNYSTSASPNGAVTVNTLRLPIPNPTPPLSLSEAPPASLLPILSSYSALLPTDSLTPCSEASCTESLHTRTALLFLLNHILLFFFCCGSWWCWQWWRPSFAHLTAFRT